MPIIQAIRGTGALRDMTDALAQRHPIRPRRQMARVIGQELACEGQRSCE
jgi:hypothetical protein